MRPWQRAHPPEYELPQLFHNLQQVNIAFCNIKPMKLLYARVKLLHRFIACLRLRNYTQSPIDVCLLLLKLLSLPKQFRLVRLGGLMSIVKSGMGVAQLFLISKLTLLFARVNTDLSL